MSGEKYKSPDAFRVALEARAKKTRDETGEGLDMVRRKLAFDALLRRVPLSGVPLVLKGGYLLHIRYGAGVRPTKDLDAALREEGLERKDPKKIERRMLEALQKVALTAGNDYFSFEIGESMADLGLGREFVGYRFNVTARVGSRVFDSFHIDCTAGDALIAPLDVVTVGAGLEFAGLEPTKVDAIRAGQHFAEKLHALCRPRTRLSSRSKDLFDMALLVRRGVEPSAVATALPVVFAMCGDTEIPQTLPSPPSGWRGPYDDMAKESSLAYSFDEACKLVSEFYDEVMKQLGDGRR